jgi:anti-anti-sigma factor
VPLLCEISKAPVLQDIPILTLSGEVNSETASILDAALETVLHEAPTNLIVNLENITYISSAGWRMFLKWERQNKRRPQFIGMQPMVRDVFEMLGFEKVFETYESLTDALRAGAASPSSPC